MQKNPYYLVLKSLFLEERLSEQEESLLGESPHWCLLYAEKVVGGRLPDNLHNRMVLGVWEDEDDREAVRRYLKDFAGKVQAV